MWMWAQYTALDKNEYLYIWNIVSPSWFWFGIVCVSSCLNSISYTLIFLFLQAGAAALNDSCLILKILIFEFYTCCLYAKQLLCHVIFSSNIQNVFHGVISVDFCNVQVRLTSKVVNFRFWKILWIFKTCMQSVF